MDFEFIEKVVRLVEKAEIAELELESEDGIYVVVKKYPSGVSASQAPVVYPPFYPGMPMPPQPGMVAPTMANTPEPVKDDASISVIKAPMVGTFYRAPAPDAPSFVEIGKTVKEDTVVCILEAMKVMNEIKSGVSGVVTEILIENGQAVEYGQAMIKVKK